jgi:hypothetical protein
MSSDSITFGGKKSELTPDWGDAKSLGDRITWGLTPDWGDIEIGDGFISPLKSDLASSSALLKVCDIRVVAEPASISA